MNKVKNIVYCAICSAILVASKEIIAVIPNVELVSFLLIMYALFLPLKMSVSIAFIFCSLQMMLYGIGIWTPMYFIVWISLCVLTYIFKNKLNSNARCALYSGFFGLIFGFLFSIPYFIISIQTGYIYFINGLVFDVIHAISNYIIMTILYEPLIPVCKQLKMRVSE